LNDYTRSKTLNTHHQHDDTMEGYVGRMTGHHWGTGQNIDSETLAVKLAAKSKEWHDRPWEIDDDRFVVDNAGGKDHDYRDPDYKTAKWGSPHGDNDFTASGHDGWYNNYFDSSWELGSSSGIFRISDASIPFDPVDADKNGYGDGGEGITTIKGTDDATNYYSFHRWHEDQNNGVVTGKMPSNPGGEVNDPVKLRCHECHVRREMRWHEGYGFMLIDPDSNNVDSNGAVKFTDLTGENLWAICNAALHQRSCEYSAGTCFVLERRTWGYVTEVSAGCKQAQACYMQKYQNFLVKAGRQCWPGDETDMIDRIARRPHDIKSDNWISNIVMGGINNKGAGAVGTSSFAAGGAFDGNPFDNTYTDEGQTSNGITYKNGMDDDGFYVTGGSNHDATHAKAATSITNTQFFNQHDHVTNAYQNGAVPTSKCYQCCNTEHNCNFQWQPKDQEDWNHAYVFGYDIKAIGDDVTALIKDLTENKKFNQPRDSDGLPTRR